MFGDPNNYMETRLKACNFISGADDCASKYANYSNAHAQTFVLFNGEMATLSKVLPSKLDRFPTSIEATNSL